MVVVCERDWKGGVLFCTAHVNSSKIDAPPFILLTFPS